ncbi:hypothetical protein MHYP_G00158300 [Metynnis hypsauchen]
MIFFLDVKMSLIIFLFLSGVLFICDGLHVLGPSSPLTVQLGGSVMLPCYVEAPIPLEELEVEWKRTDSGTLVHLFQDGESRPEAQNQAYSGRASFFTEEVKRGNFSLLLTNLTTKDAGIYNCSVYRQQETGQTSVEINEIEYLIVTGGHVVSAYVGEDITLNCSVESHIPPKKLEVLWKTVDQHIPVLIFQNGEVLTESTHERYTDRVEFFSPEERQKGNFSFRLKDLRTEDKGQYICEVFSGEFAANTTVEVQQLGFSSIHTGILLLCALAFVVPVFLSYPASTSLTKDYSRRALAVQYTLVCCPNIALCLAFILWGVTEGFFTEAATCSALNLLRILFLFWIAPYLNTLQENIGRFIKQSAITVGYAVITSFAYSGLALHFLRLYQGSQKIGILISPIFLLMSLLPLYIFSFIQGIKKIKHGELLNLCLTEAINFGRSFVSMYAVTIATFLLATLPILQLCLNMLSFLIIIHKGTFSGSKGTFSGSKGLYRGSKVLIWMSLLFILEAISATSSVYIHYVSLVKLETQKERVGLSCVTAYLYILSGMIFFKALFHFYGYFTRRPHSSRTRQSGELNDTVTEPQQTSELNDTVTEPQQTSGHATVYMLGAVGLIFVNSIALAVELILKARRGERTVEDLRVILLPSECIFAICCLILHISEFWQSNRERLICDLKDLCQLCACKQVSVDSPVQNYELQALQNSRG